MENQVTKSKWVVGATAFQYFVYYMGFKDKKIFYRWTLK